jgi:hypothetical protein
VGAFVRIPDAGNADASAIAKNQQEKISGVTCLLDAL